MMQRWRIVITFVASLNIAAFLLQGCGGGDSPTPTPIPTPEPTPAPTPGPAPPGPQLDFVPIRGVTYSALPCTAKDSTDLGACNQIGVPRPGLDYVQEGYSAMWGKDGRDDLGTLLRLGANSVRVDSALGLESTKDHSAFLDRAQELGLHVMLGFHTQMICPKFNCFDAWKTAAKVGLANGLKAKVGGGWHPAVTMLILQDSPDILNFGNVTPASCTDDDKSPNALAKCRVRAVLSAMDGLLMAEKESGVKSTVNITAAWSSQVQDSIDGKVKQGIGIYGFQDMVAGVARPGLAGYKFMSSERDVKAAFEGRWTHSINTASGWDFVKEKVGDLYEQYQFPPKKWFLAEYQGVGLGPKQLTQDLQSMDEEGEKGKHFLGANVYQFQSDYTNPTPQLFGLFGLGNASTGQTTDVCQEDETTHVAHCAKWPAYCLDSERSRAPYVASGWNGSTATLHGQCAKLLSKANINNTSNSTDLDSRPALSGQSGVRVVV
mmetsp:Transcript_43963/g.87211  ORF Transcript_43963/g.87211 Transcript_43963/m.87211 type:complete len:491 (+) Transcript_43963:56-1528(+)